MGTRAESAAATRRALLDAAADLLDEGGPDAVTLRAVGARAGVSRGAPYGHFADKDHLLRAVAAENWERVGREQDRLVAEPGLCPAEKLERSLSGLLEVGRRRPHAYALMFGPPDGEAPDLQAAVSRTHDQFLTIVASVVGGREDARPIGALLMASVHGIIGMEHSGHLTAEKWHVSGDGVLGMLIARIATGGDGPVLPPAPHAL